MVHHEFVVVYVADLPRPHICVHLKWAIVKRIAALPNLPGPALIWANHEGTEGETWTHLSLSDVAAIIRKAIEEMEDGRLKFLAKFIDIIADRQRTAGRTSQRVVQLSLDGAEGQGPH